MSEAKVIVYRYDDLDATEEEETDLTGYLEIPKVGDIVFRRNQAWKVMGVVSRVSEPTERDSTISCAFNGRLSAAFCKLAEPALPLLDDFMR